LLRSLFAGINRNSLAKKKHKKNTPSRNKTRITRAKKPFFTWRFLIKSGIQLVLLGIFLTTFFVLLVWLGMFGSLPASENLTNIENHTASEVFSADGKLMGRYYIENRLSIGNKNISPHVINALIATEDSRFFEHKGIDYISLGRVLFKTMIARNKSQGGGSTISQQLARNLFPRTGNSMFDLTVSKVKEIIIANRLEKIYNKEQILNLYLNTVSFGEEIFGIETASQRFFSKSAGELYPYEAATLIGMLAANTAYSPRLYPGQSKKRRNIVLRRMEEQGWIDSGDYSKWITEPIHLSYRRIDHNTGIAPYFRDVLQKELENYLKENFGDSINLYTDGLRIHTSIESEIQAYSEEAVRLQMNKLQKEFNEHWRNQSPWDDSNGLFIESVRESTRYRKLLNDGHKEIEIMDLLAKPISTLPGDPEGKKGKLSPLDSIRQNLLTLHAGFLAIDPTTGSILAWVGGINHKEFQYDHVTSKRQVGSTFKPIVYAAALEKGIKPCDFFSNEKRIYKNYDDWSPSNSEGSYDGFYSMKGALAHSVNTVSAELIFQTGIPRVISLAKKMGIDSPIPEVPSIALGAADISLKEMVFAYSSFINQGQAVEPVGISRIEDKEGNLLFAHNSSPESKVILSNETTITMIHMLKEVVDSGTACSLHNVYQLKSELGGKTGTTQDNADGWFIGFTPNILAGCWVGAENPSVHFRTTRLGQGAYTALPIFARFIQKLENSPHHKAYTSGTFPLLPAHLVKEFDCPDFSMKNPRFNFIERLFRRDAQRDSIRAIKKEERKLRQKEKRSEREKDGIRGGLRKLFDRKKKKSEGDSIH